MLRPSAGDLGFPEASLADVAALLSGVPFEPAMIALCRLQAMNWSIARDGHAQLDLARDFFGENELIDRFATFVAAHENGVLFSEQEFFVVQRLLVEEAQDGSLDDGMDHDAFVALASAIVMARSIIDVGHAELEREEPRHDVILAYLVQNGAYFESRNLLNSFARAYSLFTEYARALAGERWACPLDEWIAEDSTLDLEEQFAGGFGLQAMTKALETDVPAGDRSLVDPVDVFARSAFRGRESDVTAMLAAPRDWYADRFAERGRDVRTVAWNRTPFEQRPFVHFANGKLGLLSPRTIEAWLSDGFYYRLLESATRRQAQRLTRRHNVVESYTSYVGKLLERWAVDLVRSIYPGERPVGGGRVHGEQPYGNGKMTPDVAIDLGVDLVLIEVRSGYLREETRISGHPREFLDDLDRVLFRKIRQLGNTIADLVAGTARIPDVDMTIVERIWPIVVTANLTQTEHLDEWITRELTAPYKNARVQKLVVLDTGDLELLMGMVERSGTPITTILSNRQTSPYAALELTRWAQEDPSSPGEARPRFAEERWNRITDSLNTVLALS